jgi:DNA-binding beta-propeller fold protein YncE
MAMLVRWKLPNLCFTAFAFLLAMNTPSVAAGDAKLSRLFSLIGDYPIGASVNRTDYESIDPAARRLYLAEMGGGQLVVFDIEHNKLIAQLNGFPKVTGVLAVPALHKIYASVPGSGIGASLLVGLGMTGFSSGHGAVAIRDTRDLKELARVQGGVFPDGIAYDPKEQMIFVSDELGSAVTVIDANTDKFVTRIETGGETGNVRYDSFTGRIFVPDQSHDRLVEIDPARLTVTARWTLPGCDHPHGFIVAPGDGGVGYVACDGNDQLVTMDLRSGRVMQKQPVAHDPDVLAVDAGLHRLYVASESGNLSTYEIAIPGAPVSLGDVFIASDAHAVAVDPNSHRLYFGLANMDGRCVIKVLAPESSQ